MNSGSQKLEVKNIIRINVGGYYASAAPATVQTSLGSCVAVCLFDPIKRIGGMNHILLPGYTDLDVRNGSARYGVNAMELLINRIMNLGGRRKNLVAKVFGGANVIESLSGDYSAGVKNTEFAVNYLENEGIKLISHNTGGRDTRIVKFHTDTGEVFLKRLCTMETPSLIFKEKESLKHVEKEIEKTGGIELFYSSKKFDDIVKF